MLKQLKALSGRGQDRGFTLIEMLIVILIVGILAAVAAPLYLGYVRDAKTAEGKSVAGALWTSLQAQGVASCGTTQTPITNAFPRAGFTSGGSTISDGGRWKSTTNGGITVDCTTGAISETGDIFTLTGKTGSDIENIQVKLSYNSANN